MLCVQFLILTKTTARKIMHIYHAVLKSHVDLEITQRNAMITEGKITF